MAVDVDENLRRQLLCAAHAEKGVRVRERERRRGGREQGSDISGIPGYTDASAHLIFFTTPLFDDTTVFSCPWE